MWLLAPGFYLYSVRGRGEQGVGAAEITLDTKSYYDIAGDIRFFARLYNSFPFFFLRRNCRLFLRVTCKQNTNLNNRTTHHNYCCCHSEPSKGTTHCRNKLGWNGVLDRCGVAESPGMWRAEELAKEFPPINNNNTLHNRPPRRWPSSLWGGT